MFIKRIKRAAVTTMAATVLAGGLGLVTAGSAAAGVDGPECRSDGVKAACIEMGSPVSASARTNFASASCTVMIILWDETTGQGWPWSLRCGVGPKPYGGYMTTTQEGHTYHTEVRIFWDGGSGYDSISSASRTARGNAG
ncbi:hypothetical protein ACFRMQ_23805 [Kitasatospora sp. NPDC056783]|uniref:hypothetical protein n=1 Tax=Kitasatospora sp. NPDC056783 TaxID=3345943 RepID=UPI003684ED91